MSDELSEIYCISYRDFLDYDVAYEEQMKWHFKVCQQESSGVIIVVEHPRTITLGKHAQVNHILVDRETLAREGITLIQTDRGGEVTAHMPGQIVLYPILPLAKLGLSPKTYVDLLSRVVIATLAEFSIHGVYDPQYPGIWVGSEKICAIGIRIRSRVSLHGIALNVSNDLSLFGKIIPCGIHARGVTSMQRQAHQNLDRAQVEKVLLKNFSEILGRPVISNPEQSLAKNI
jgi:lipoate-protein ligase B